MFNWKGIGVWSDSLMQSIPATFPGWTFQAPATIFEQTILTNQAKSMQNDQQKHMFFVYKTFEGCCLAHLPAQRPQIRIASAK